MPDEDKPSIVDLINSRMTAALDQLGVETASLLGAANLFPSYTTYAHSYPGVKQDIDNSLSVFRKVEGIIQEISKQNSDMQFLHYPGALCISDLFPGNETHRLNYSYNPNMEATAQYIYDSIRELRAKRGVGRDRITISELEHAFSRVTFRFDQQYVAMMLRKFTLGVSEVISLHELEDRPRLAVMAIVARAAAKLTQKAEEYGYEVEA